MARSFPPGSAAADTSAGATRRARSCPLIALSCGSIYTYGLARVFDLAQAAGFAAVEVIVGVEWDTHQVAYLRRLQGESGIHIASIHSPFLPRIPGWPQDEVGRVQKTIRLAAAVGAELVNLHLPRRFVDLTVQVLRRRLVLPLPVVTEDAKQYASWLRRGSRAAAAATDGVVVSVENLPHRRLWGQWGRYNPYAMNTVAELSTFPHITLDSTHWGTTGADLLAIYDVLRSRIAHVHLSNYDGRAQHRPLDQGHLPLDHLLHALRADSYRGVVVIELDPAQLPAHDEAKLTGSLRRAYDFCATHLL